MAAKENEGYPQQDQRWIAMTLWKNERLRDDVKQIWYEPPEPSLTYSQVPHPERLFCHLLMVLMPYHQGIKKDFRCTKCNWLLKGGGAHKRARQVLDVDRYYLLITECLR